MSLESFEEDNLAATANLMNLCLRAPRNPPPAFALASSISAVLDTPEQSINEVVPASPATASKGGYGRSKWVAEKLCEVASKERGLPTRVLRIGQIVGDSEQCASPLRLWLWIIDAWSSGIWNETEAVPLMFRTADVLHALPDLDEVRLRPFAHR